MINMGFKSQVAVIGLGKFGYKFGETLMELGHEVMGIDSDPAKVENAKNVFSQVFQVDAMHRDALEQIRVQDMEHVLVSVGDSIAASVMISMYLKELGAKNVWAKAIHKDHEKILYKVGVDEVVIPEFMAANEIANRIAMPGFIENLSFDKDMAVKEISIDDWAGKTLREIDITNRYSLQVIAVKAKGHGNYRYIPRADDVLEAGDVLVVIGNIEQLKQLAP